MEVDYIVFRVQHSGTKCDLKYVMEICWMWTLSDVLLCDGAGPTHHCQADQLGAQCGERSFRGGVVGQVARREGGRQDLLHH